MEEVDTILNYTDVIRIITAAPEVPGVLDFAAKLISRGVVASIGHSNATFEESSLAVERGFTMVTHIYSVMSSMMRVGNRKVAGVLEAALLRDELAVGVIGDGFHVPEPFFKMVLKSKSPDKIVIVTDSIRATGLPDGKYALGTDEESHAVVVERGIAMTPDRKLYAGSVATMEKCVRNAVDLGGVSVKDAVAMVTVNPARLLGMDEKIGELKPSRCADMVILDKRLTPVYTIIDGRVVYQREDVGQPNH
jgi:N-acetylglucosamine-6-phosphate deacetylase